MLDLTDEQLTEAARYMARQTMREELKRPCTIVEVINCPDCDGDGYCTACGGTGQNEDDHDADGRCSPCEGTGGCAACDGTGTNGDCEIISPGTDLSRAWGAASGEGEVAS